MNKSSDKLDILNDLEINEKSNNHNDRLDQIEKNNKFEIKNADIKIKDVNIISNKETEDNTININNEDRDYKLKK